MADNDKQLIKAKQINQKVLVFDGHCDTILEIMNHKRTLRKKLATGDVSHLSETGFWDVIKRSNAPIVASYSNCYALCPHLRNLKDE